MPNKKTDYGKRTHPTKGKITKFGNPGTDYAAPMGTPIPKTGGKAVKKK